MALTEKMQSNRQK